MDWTYSHAHTSDEARMHRICHMNRLLKYKKFVRVKLYVVREKGMNINRIAVA